ncbi:MAG: hypothetical protein ACR2KQ_07090 [Actinomycetota bacterium]
MAERVRPPGTGALVVSAARRVPQGPFLMLLALTMFLTIVSTSFGSSAPDGFSTTASILLLVVGTFIQIAVVLAAADPDPAPSADVWVKEALRRQLFLRYFVTSLLAALLIVLGLVAFLVGAAFVAAFVGLAPTAAALERLGPVDAVRRSLQLSKPARWQVGLIVTLFLMAPTILTTAGDATGLAADLGIAWTGIILASVAVSMVGSIALAQLFVILRAVDETARP